MDSDHTKVASKQSSLIETSYKRSVKDVLNYTSIVLILKETRNSYFCVNPQKSVNVWLPKILKHCHKKVIVCSYYLGEENF